MLCTLNPIPLFTLYALRSMLNQRNPGTPPPIILNPLQGIGLVFDHRFASDLNNNKHKKDHYSKQKIACCRKIPWLIYC